MRPRVARTARPLRRIEPGMVMGTVGYMSPEQVRGESVDARSDIFSFGCVLYEMFVGKRAFQAPTGVETMHAILNADPPEIEAEPVKMPPAVMTIVRRCLEKRPEQRFQSAADLAFALRSITGTTVTGCRCRGPPLGCASRWLVPVAAALAGVALLALGFFLRDRTLKRYEPQFQRITFRKGWVDAARFVPHSRNVVYSASWEGGPSHIYLSSVRAARNRGTWKCPGTARLAAISAQQDLALLTPPLGDYNRAGWCAASISGGQTRPLLDGVLAADWAPDGVVDGGTAAGERRQPP